MTKRILCLILSLCILFLSTGCNNEVEEGEPVRPTYRATANVYDNVPFPISDRIGDAGYSYFESFLNRTTNIVKATFLGTVKVAPDDYFFNFKVTEEIKGRVDKDEISLFVYTECYMWLPLDKPDYDTYRIDYEVGKNYLLMFQRVSMTHLQEDLLRPIHDSLVIPLDDNGIPDISSSLMYNTPFIEHVKDENLKQDILDGKLIERVLDLTRDNPEFADNVDINTTDVTDILKQSECIIVVRINEVYEYDRAIHNFFSRSCDCVVLEVIKGECSKDEIKRITLTTSKIEVGGTYLLAVNFFEGDSKNIYLSSKNSIFPWEMEE